MEELGDTEILWKGWQSQIKPAQTSYVRTKLLVLQAMDTALLSGPLFELNGPGCGWGLRLDQDRGEMLGEPEGGVAIEVSLQCPQSDFIT